MLRQVLCSLSPPDGCLQWHEGTSGSVQSFNNGGTGTHLASQVRHTGYLLLCLQTLCTNVNRSTCKKQAGIMPSKINSLSWNCEKQKLTKPAKYSYTTCYILATDNTDKHAWRRVTRCACGGRRATVPSAGLPACFRSGQRRLRHFRSFAEFVLELSTNFHDVPLLPKEGPY